MRGALSRRDRSPLTFDALGIFGTFPEAAGPVWLGTSFPTGSAGAGNAALGRKARGEPEHLARPATGVLVAGVLRIVAGHTRLLLPDGFARRGLGVITLTEHV